MDAFRESIVSLIVKTSTDLPPDVRAAMRVAMNEEPEGSRAAQALTIIGQNIDQAAEGEGAICQDTGMPTFEVKTPVGANQIWMKQQIREAVAEATRRGKLRPNSVDSLTGENSGDNLGPGTPIIHFEQWEPRRHRGEADSKRWRLRKHERAVLASDRAAASRTRRSHARRRAQVHPACGVARAGQRVRARRGWRLHRRRPHVGLRAARRSSCFALSTTSTATRGWPISKRRVMRTVNTLGVGAMGFGGRVSLIGCKVGALNRLPASFFVSVAYDCWAFRRLGVVLDATSGAIVEVAVSRSGGADHPDDGPGRLPPDWARSRADNAAR